MSEIPRLKINFPDSGEFHATPNNAKLFTFMGRTALQNGDTSDNTLRNHIYLLTRTEGEPDSGKYIFGPDVKRIGAVMLKLNFPANLNEWAVPAGDEQAYQTYLSNNDEVADTFPEDWK